MNRPFLAQAPRRIAIRLAALAGLGLLATSLQAEDTAAASAEEVAPSAPSAPPAVPIPPQAEDVETVASPEVIAVQPGHQLTSRGISEELHYASEEVESDSEEPPRPQGPNLELLTSSPASATAAWPTLWGEGTASHRAEMASMENREAPTLASVEWVVGGEPNLSSPETLTVLAYWPLWVRGESPSLTEISTRLRERVGFGLQPQLAVVVPATTSEELAALTSAMPGALLAGIDRNGSVRRAYGVDSYPDCTLIGGGGVVICADIRPEHVINAVDACLLGWRPWRPASPEAVASSESIASPAAEWRIEISPTPGSRPLTPEERARILATLAELTASGASLELQVTGSVSPEAAASPEDTALSGGEASLDALASPEEVVPLPEVASPEADASAEAAG